MWDPEEIPHTELSLYAISSVEFCSMTIFMRYSKSALKLYGYLKGLLFRFFLFGAGTQGDDLYVLREC